MFSWNKFNWLNFISQSVKTWWRMFLRERNILKYLFQAFFLFPLYFASSEFLMLFNYLDLISIEICPFIVMVFWYRYLIDWILYLKKKRNLLINEIFWNKDFLFIFFTLFAFLALYFEVIYYNLIWILLLLYS